MLALYLCNTLIMVMLSVMTWMYQLKIRCPQFPVHLFHI